MATKKQERFRATVQTLCQCFYARYVDRVNLKLIADCVGKSFNVTDQELNHQDCFMSDAAYDFVGYQLYIKGFERPVWYQPVEVD